MPELSLSVIVITGLLVLGGAILFSLITSNKSKDLDGRRIKSKTRGADHRKLTKQEKKLQIHANQLIQLKRFVEAAQIFESIKMHREAIDLLEKNDFVDEAAATLLRMNLPNRAAVIYHRNGYFSNAAECFVKAGMYPEAAKAAIEGGDHKRAASLFEKAKLFSEAAKSYEKVGDYLSSARNLVHGKHIGFAIASYKQYLNNLEKIDKFSLNESDQLALITWITQGNFDEVIVSGLQKIGLLPKVVTKVCQLGNMKHCAEIIALGDDYDFNSIISEINYDDHSTIGLADAFFLAGKYNSAGMIFEQLQKFGEAARAFEKAEAFDRSLYCYERAGDHGNASRVRPLIRKNKPSGNHFPQDFSIANMQSDSRLNFAKNEKTAQYPNQDQAFSLNESTVILETDAVSEHNHTPNSTGHSDFKIEKTEKDSVIQKDQKEDSENFDLDKTRVLDVERNFESASDISDNDSKSSLVSSSEIDLNFEDDDAKKTQKSTDFMTTASDSSSTFELSESESDAESNDNGWLSSVSSQKTENSTVDAIGAGSDDSLSSLTFIAQPKNREVYSLDDETNDSIEKTPEAIAIDLQGEVLGFAVEHSPTEPLNIRDATSDKNLFANSHGSHSTAPRAQQIMTPSPKAEEHHTEGTPESQDEQLIREKNQTHHQILSSNPHGAQDMSESSARLKSNAVTKQVTDCFSGCELFSELSTSEIDKIWAAGQILSLDIGQDFITGRRNTDGIFVVLSGSLDCFKQDLSMEQFVGSLSEGESFGELAVLAHMPTEIKLVSKYDCEIWFCDKITFDNFLGQNGKIATKLFRYYLLGVLHRLSQLRKVG